MSRNESAATTPSRRELLCERCNREHPVWFAPNAVWNAVVRPNQDQGDEFSFLCPLCFIVLAEERGMTPTGWMVAPADAVTTSMTWRLAEAAPGGLKRDLLLLAEETYDEGVAARLREVASRV